MYAIVNLGNGHYCNTAVFGFYNDIIEKYGSWKQYAIVLDEKKEKLIKFSEYDQKKMPNLYKVLLFTEGDQSDWTIDENGYGEVASILQNKAMALELVQNGTPDDILKKCLAYDARNPYTETQGIRNEKDIDNLMWCSGYFHDAYIKSLTSIDDGILVTFDGVWGCKIEITFTGDVTYNTESRDPDEYDPYWDGATVAFHDGYIYMVDEYDMEIEGVPEGYCWFRGRNMSYHVIPN